VLSFVKLKSRVPIKMGNEKLKVCVGFSHNFLSGFVVGLPVIKVMHLFINKKEKPG
jgi:hypothetical protein